MSKIGLNYLANLQNENTAITQINDNSSIIQTAFDNTLSRDGTQPNVMSASIDMNSNPILNLPTPGSNYEPLRLIDANTIKTGGSITVSPLPTGGTANQVLTKNSSTNYDVSWKDSTGARAPTFSIRSTAGSGTYTTPANCLYLEVEMVGGGGGGWGSGVSATSGTNGGDSFFGTYQCTGGQTGLTQAAGGLPGNAFGVAGNLNLFGQQGQSGNTAVFPSPGGDGGCSPLGGNGKGGSMGAGVGGNGVSNTGSGGGGGGASASTVNSGGGGGSGGYMRTLITNPASSYFYQVGSGGFGGNAGTNGAVGGVGGAGVIVIKEYYQ